MTEILTIYKKYHDNLRNEFLIQLYNLYFSSVLSYKKMICAIYLCLSVHYKTMFTCLLYSCNIVYKLC